MTETFLTNLQKKILFLGKKYQLEYFIIYIRIFFSKRSIEEIKRKFNLI